MSDVNLQRKCLCIFCHEAIEPGSLDPCSLLVTAGIDQLRSSQKEQTFFCHIACLRGTAHRAMLSGFYIDERNFSTIGEIEEAAGPEQEQTYLH